MYRYSYGGSTVGTAWGNLLFKVAAVPFVVLLIAMVANQIVSVRNHMAVESTAEVNTSVGFSGETLF